MDGSNFQIWTEGQKNNLLRSPLGSPFSVLALFPQFVMVKGIYSINILETKLSVLPQCENRMKGFQRTCLQEELIAK